MYFQIVQENKINLGHWSTFSGKLYQVMQLYRDTCIQSNGSHHLRLSKITHKHNIIILLEIGIFWCGFILISVN